MKEELPFQIAAFPLQPSELWSFGASGSILRRPPLVDPPRLGALMSNSQMALLHWPILSPSFPHLRVFVPAAQARLHGVCRQILNHSPSHSWLSTIPLFCLIAGISPPYSFLFLGNSSPLPSSALSVTEHHYPPLDSGFSSSSAEESFRKHALLFFLPLPTWKNERGSESPWDPFCWSLIFRCPKKILLPQPTFLIFLSLIFSPRILCQRFNLNPPFSIILSYLFFHKVA